MSIRLIGANPGLSLFVADGETPSAYASVWRVDWSERGSGNAIVVWHDGHLRVVGPNRELGEWLAGSFNRHFPEVRDLEWAEPEVTAAPVDFSSDLAKGIRAEGADIVVSIEDPIDRRLIRLDEFYLGTDTNLLSTVIAPCLRGSITVGGSSLPGDPRVSRDPPASSSAFLADAEVWSWPT